MKRTLSRPGVQATVVAVMSALLLGGYEWFLTRTSSVLYAGYRFQAWSSEEFMQEVRINDLMKAGPDALWYLHFQPPLLDGIRLLLVLPEYLARSTVAAQVIDQRMYALYVILYGCLNALVFIWLRMLTSSLAWSLVGTVLFALYPGTLAMATLLDGTFLAALLVTFMLLAMTLAIRNKSAGWLNAWLFSLLALALLKSMFQLQVLVLIPVLAFVMYRWFIKRATWPAIAISVVLVVAIFLPSAKAYALFATTSTSTDFGSHQVEVVSYRPTQSELDAVVVPDRVSRNAERFVSGENTPAQADLNFVMTEVGKQYYASHPAQVVKNLIWAVEMNVVQALKFTHEYSNKPGQQPNILVATLPWTPPVIEGLSTATYLAALLLMSTATVYAFGWSAILRRVQRYWPVLVMVLPIAATVLVANRYDWTEADRLKFILEPMIIILFVSSVKWAVDARLAHSRDRQRNVDSVDSRSSRSEED